ncbi:hypothetical protein EVAR_81146_1 [Eumeta japonica]|uniref:Uncharacterized protein n=1 Tax=Eumeta variegata TaxID=151549 RepID=A0A4C1UK14_EUMVA|nr:hypothetical protein EVAR_81146_1 [Eumeta japonica]
MIYEAGGMDGDACFPIRPTEFNHGRALPRGSPTEKERSFPAGDVAKSNFKCVQTRNWKRVYAAGADAHACHTVLCLLRVWTEADYVLANS